MCFLGFTLLGYAKAQPPSDPAEAMRKRIPIAKGEFPHVQPEFFPDGSGPDMRVIYQTEKDPRF